MSKARGQHVFLIAAFVLIILLIITLGTIGFGWFCLRVQQVTNAARHGARIAIRDGSTFGDVEQAVADCLVPVGLTYNGPTAPYGIDPNAGEPIKITVKGTGLDILNLSQPGILFIPIPESFSASVTMAKEGP